ncbi:MAG: hypothetical protein LBO74_15330 [Candidatus Symbiothrix sp.]|nr:hypothetical protein [Candidatus Symbiothrix sp.]
MSQLHPVDLRFFIYKHIKRQKYEITAITPEELAGGNVVFDVVFSAESSGTYTAAIVIENADIETLTIPLTVNYTKQVGINNVLSGVSVY